MNNMEIKHLALKSYRRRSISQANKKVSSERERISKLLDPHKKQKKGPPSVNQLRFATEKLIKPKIRLYDGF